MSNYSRLELFDREHAVSIPARIPTVLVPHVVLIGVIASASTVDAVYEAVMLFRQLWGA